MITCSHQTHFQKNLLQDKQLLGISSPSQGCNTSSMQCSNRSCTDPDITEAPPTQGAAKEADVDEEAQVEVVNPIVAEEEGTA